VAGGAELVAIALAGGGSGGDCPRSRNLARTTGSPTPSVQASGPGACGVKDGPGAAPAARADDLIAAERAPGTSLAATRFGSRRVMMRFRGPNTGGNIRRGRGQGTGKVPREGEGRGPRHGCPPCPGGSRSDLLVVDRARSQGVDCRSRSLLSPSPAPGTCYRGVPRIEVGAVSAEGRCYPAPRLASPKVGDLAVSASQKEVRGLRTPSRDGRHHAPRRRRAPGDLAKDGERRADGEPAAAARGGREESHPSTELHYKVVVPAVSRRAWTWSGAGGSQSHGAGSGGTAKEQPLSRDRREVAPIPFEGQKPAAQGFSKARYTYPIHPGRGSPDPLAGGSPGSRSGQALDHATDQAGATIQLRGCGRKLVGKREGGGYAGTTGSFERCRGRTP